MIRFVDSIRKAVEFQNWFAALFLALAIPDVCGALENPNAGVGARYRNWFNRYLKKKYDPDSMFDLVESTSPETLSRLPSEAIASLKQQKPNLSCAFTADYCYLFRCKCLHQGLPERAGGDRIHFTEPDLLGRSQLHMNVMKGIYQLSIDAFCLDICKAIEQWLQDVQDDVDIQTRMRELIEIHHLADPRFPIVKYE